jgi:hypothetical protein
MTGQYEFMLIALLRDGDREPRRRVARGCTTVAPADGSAAAPECLPLSVVAESIIRAFARSEKIKRPDVLGLTCAVRLARPSARKGKNGNRE